MVVITAVKSVIELRRDITDSGHLAEDINLVVVSYTFSILANFIDWQVVLATNGGEICTLLNSLKNLLRIEGHSEPHCGGLEDAGNCLIASLTLLSSNGIFANVNVCVVFCFGQLDRPCRSTLCRDESYG